MKNAAVADMFDKMADIMEIKGENAFRVNSYRNVARVVRDLTEDIEHVHKEGRLLDLAGVGKSSAEKITQFLETGRMKAYEDLVKDFPVGALDMLRIPHVGPKTVGRLMHDKGITSIEQLEKAIQKGDLEGMAGMGAKTIENLKTGIEFLRSSAGRILLGKALPVAQAIVAALKEKVDVEAIEPAGSLRRMRETIGDIDILTTVKPKGRKPKEADEIPGGKEVVEAFVSLPNVAEVLAAGGTKGSVRTEEGLQVDLRVVSPESFGAALVYFTGSKAHNIKIRGIALDKGLKINEYGVFKGEDRIAGATEEKVYKSLKLPWIPPELREDRGEVEAAAAGKLPKLVTLEDIRGDLHAHTNHSDGALSVLQMAEAAKAMGYSYIAITDHSPSLGVASGLNVARLRKQHAEIEAAQKQLRGFRILKGTEADILADGRIDYPDEVLADLDIVVASVHTRFGMSEKEMTERIIKAVRNPYVTAIGHLTGRLIGQRDTYQVDVGAVIAACAEEGCALELNSHMDRLDITDIVCHQAKQAGVKVLIGTDAHHSEHYWMMKLGVATARRGWLEKGDVLNCMEADELRQYLHARR
jgi:DNA polymerase (family 10)